MSEIERYPIAPLWRQAELSWGVNGTGQADGFGEGANSNGPGARPFCVEILAVMVGVDCRTVERWKRDGLSLRVAERAAQALGFGVWDLWPEQYWTESAALCGPS